MHHGCPQIGGDEMVSVEIARPVANNFFQVTACFRSPNDAAQKRGMDWFLKQPPIKFSGIA
jgi:hypothetical protein